MYGKVIILNGAPRSGKSSIVKAVQNSFDGVWFNIGNDVYIKNIIPENLKPGMGLRPNAGADYLHIEKHVLELYKAMYETIALHAKQGFNVIVDVGHHNAYVENIDTVAIAKDALKSLDVLWVGVKCSIDKIMRRRNSGNDTYLKSGEQGDIPKPVLMWQEEVHKNISYDLEVDTSKNSAEECAEIIERFVIN